MAMRQIARLSLAREVAALRGRGIPVVAFQPTAADLEVMGGDSLDPAKLAPVCDGSWRPPPTASPAPTSATASPPPSSRQLSEVPDR